MPQDVLANLGLQGQNKNSISKLLENKSLREFYKNLSDIEKKLALKGAELGVKEVDKLVKALEAAAKAAEEYNGKIEKYVSTFKQLTNAYKEGREQTKLYLQEAGKTGGSIAVFGAAVSLLTKELKKNIDTMNDYVNTVRRYDVEQEKFSRASLIQKKNLDSMRWSLALTKDEMLKFFDELKRGETMGLDTKNMEAAFSKLKGLYGKGAMEMFSSYQDILSKMPTISNQIKGGGFKGFGEGDVYNLMANKQYSTMLQLKSAGMFGGEAEKSKAAEVENAQKLMDSFGEYVKDEASRYYIPSLTYFSKMVGGITELTGVAVNILSILGIMSAMNTAGKVKSIAGGIGSVLTQGAAGIPKGFSLRTGAKIGMALGRAGTALGTGGLVLGGSLAGIAGGQYLGAGISKAIGMNAGYTPGELKDALATQESRKSFVSGFFKNPFSSRNFKAEEEELTKEEKDGISFGVNPYRYYKDKSGKTGVRSVGDQKTLLAFGKEMGNIYDQTEQINNQWRNYYEDIKNIAEMNAEMSSLSGDIAGYEEEMYTKEATMAKERKKMISLYEDQEEEIRKKMKDMEQVAGFEQSVEYQAAQGALQKLEQKMTEADLTLINGRISVMDAIIKEQIEQGGAGGKGSVKIRMAKALAETAMMRAQFAGGEFQAAGGLRTANINDARNKLKGIENAIQTARNTMNTLGVGPEVRTAAEKELISLEKQRAEAELNLKEAMISIADLEVLTRDIEIYMKGLNAQQSYVEAINGSYQALKPFWEAEVDTKKRLAEIAKSDMQRMAMSEGTGSQKYKEKEAEYAVRALDAKKAELELSKKIRDHRKEEISYAADWMKEQADYIEEMGGSIGQILSYRTQALEKEREMISAQQDFIEKGVQSGTLEGFELIKAQTDLERMKMKMTRDSIGIQKSAYEKFVGMAFGLLSDVGFKQNRMSDAVLMGTGATRVKGRDGLYRSGAPKVTRDQALAIMATGGNIEGLSGKDLKKADYFTGSRVEQAKTQEELQVNGKIKLDLDKGLILKMEDWSFNLSKNKEFGQALVQANRIVTETNTRASGASK